MFPENIPNLSSNREFELGIELLSGSVSISIPHYRITSIELNGKKRKRKERIIINLANDGSLLDGDWLYYALMMRRL